ncbi:DUF1906 domain-containing protein [Paenibacillus humicola]|uniref:DUF1906 domain-containing protein n=1 Tax=Paenibacillus humicola TaxID=3110540 RepID=UPI00237AA1C9|nr:DUF1906 domain-containing protein [Paenibacillus humicola]
MKGFDCAIPLNAARAKALAAAGMTFAARYLVPPAYAWKRLTAAEAQIISDAGMRIVSVFELSANRVSQGAAAGFEDGILALAEARLVGQPAGSAIYFAVDYDAQPADYDAIEQYLRSARSQIYGYDAGVYGSYAVIEEMARRGACERFWQTYAWSRGSRSGRANIYQYRNGVSVAGVPLDLNESYGSEGWWSLKKEVKPKMKQADAEKIIRFLSAAWFAATTPQDKAEFNRLANEVRKAAGLPEQS